MKAGVSDIHRLEVVVLESESIGVAKLSEDLPSCLLPPSLDEQLVQEEKSYKRIDTNSILGGGGREGGRERENSTFHSEAIIADSCVCAFHDDVLDILESLRLERGIETVDLYYVHVTGNGNRTHGRLEVTTHPTHRNRVTVFVYTA